MLASFLFSFGFARPISGNAQTHYPGQVVFFFPGQAKKILKPCPQARISPHCASAILSRWPQNGVCVACEWILWVYLKIGNPFGWNFFGWWFKGFQANQVWGVSILRHTQVGLPLRHSLSWSLTAFCLPKPRPVFGVPYVCVRPNECCRVEIIQIGRFSVACGPGIRRGFPREQYQN